MRDDDTSSLRESYDRRRTPVGTVVPGSSTARRPRRSAIVRLPSARLARGRLAAISAEQDLAECESEVGIEDGVDDRVEETVDVAEPDDDARQRGRVGAAHRVVAAERLDERRDEERQPADDERPGHDRQRPGGLALSLLLLLGASGRQQRQLLVVRPQRRLSLIHI